MRKLIDAVWEDVEIVAETMHEKNKKIKLDKAKKQNLINYFNYNLDIVKKYMYNPKEHLDRHKMAAIIIISLVKAKPLEYPDDEKDDKIFVGNYVMASEIGLAFMREQLNEILIKKNEMLVSKYFFPESWTCDNDYFRVFYRNLYYSDQNSEWGLNPLDIAEKLFLLEYLTLSKQGANVHVLEVQKEK